MSVGRCDFEAQGPDLQVEVGEGVFQQFVFDGFFDVVAVFFSYLFRDRRVAFEFGKAPESAPDPGRRSVFEHDLALFVFEDRKDGLASGPLPRRF